MPALNLHDITIGYDVPEEVRLFAHSAAGDVVFGPGAISQVGGRVAHWGCKHAMLVTDPGIAQAGHLDPARASLHDLGLATTTYDHVRENPTTEDVEACATMARQAGIDLLIGIGGGSSMDTAKGANFLLTNGGQMSDYWGVGKASQPMLPLVAIPTTAGTGSECQSFALIADAKTHAKMACGDPKAAAKLAILDPELTLTQPRLVTAQTGLDAFVHAVETAVCSRRSPISSAYSLLAFRLIDEAFPVVLEHPSDLYARGMMQMGAAYAGTAIENSMLGAAHSLANPLTAHFDIVHGLAVSIMLPHVISYNRTDRASDEIYDHLCPSGLEAHLTDLLKHAKLPHQLRHTAADKDMFPILAEKAAAQWTAQFNPVPVSAESMLQLYRSAW